MATEPDHYDWQTDQFVYPDGTRINAEHDRHNPEDYLPDLTPTEEALIVHIADQLAAAFRGFVRDGRDYTTDPRYDPL